MAINTTVTRMQGTAFDTLDFQTPAGYAIKEFIERRLEVLREQLESVELSDQKTWLTRGAISELRRMLQQRPEMQQPARYDNMQFDSRRGA